MLNATGLLCKVAVRYLFSSSSLFHTHDALNNLSRAISQVPVVGLCVQDLDSL